MTTTPSEPRRPWEAMRLTRLGHIDQIVLGGGAKLSLIGADPGEYRKERGSGR